MRNRRLSSSRARLTLVGALGLAALFLAVGVYAFWSSAGTGSAAASTATLGAPSITSAAPGAGTVALTWSAATPPGAGAVTYSVSRDGGDAGGTCPTAGSPAGVTSCTDSGLAAGTYVYTVTARWWSWTAASTTSTVTVVSGAATQLVLAAATTTPVSGAADELTITARDAGNNLVASYTGDRSLTFSGAGTIGAFQPTVTGKNGTAVAFGTATTITFTNGVATVSGASNGVMRLYKAEAASILVSDGTIGNGAGLPVTVSVGPAAKLAFTQQPGGATGGVAFATQPKVTIQDLAGNAVTTDTSSVTLALTVPGGATLSCTSNPVAAVTGVASFAGCRVNLAGSYTLTATDGGLTAAVSSSFTIEAPSTLPARATGNWNAVDTWTAVALPGTISSLTTSRTVTGTGTAFLSQLRVGDRILRSDGTTSIGIVQSLASDTSLTLTANASSTNTNIAYTARRLPTATDAVSVLGAFTVTIPAAYAAVASSLTIGSPANILSQTVTLAAATSTLTTGGDVTVSAPNGTATRTLAVAAGTLSVGGGMYLSAGASGTPSSRVNRVTMTTGTASVAGSLVLNAGNFPSVHPSQNQITISSTGTFNLAGAFTILNGGGTPAGTVTPGTTSTFNFNGSSAQTIPIGVSSITYANLTTNNTSASGATLSAAITGTRVTGNLTVATGTLDNGGSAITLAGNRSLSVASGATLELGGTTGMVVVSGSGTKTFGATSTVDYGGADQTVANETYGNLSLSGSGVKTLPATGPTIAGNLSISGTTTTMAAAGLTVNGAFTLGAGSTFNASTFSHTVKGAFSNSGTLDAGTSTFTLDGTSAQAIGGASATTFNNLTLGNAAGVSLGGVDAAVGGTLALGPSILATGANTVTASGAVTRTTGFVNGRLRKPVATGASTPLFEVGTGSSYTPISLTLAGASVGGSLTASSTTGRHPSSGSSGISATKYVDRYWTLTAGGGLTATSYTGVFTFVPADLVGSPNTAALVARRFVGPSTWTAATTPSSTATTVTGTFTTTFGDYAAGE